MIKEPKLVISVDVVGEIRMMLNMKGKAAAL